MLNVGTAGPFDVRLHHATNNFKIVAFTEIGSSGRSEVASIATLDEGVSILTP